MIRQLFVIVFVMGLGWLFRRLFSVASQQPAQRPGGAPRAPEQAGAEMVRDRICNTFLPRTSALTSQVGGEQHFFCSERCRQTFLKKT